MAKQQPESPADKPVEEVSAKLKKPHRHKGIQLPAGAEISLTKGQAERLTRRDVI
jgi:hypothetical protein